MAAETKRPRLGALHSVEAGLHMHQRAQAKRAAVANARDPDDLRGHLCGPAYVPRPTQRGALARWFKLLERTADRGLGAMRLRGALPRWSQRLERTADRVRGIMRLRWVRRVGLGMAGTLAVCLLIAATLWWRLSSGPISLDMITPWLTAAIAENLGNQFRIEVGGTVLERDEHGRAAMRIRDITVRDRDGTMIASAPRPRSGCRAQACSAAVPAPNGSISLGRCSPSGSNPTAGSRFRPARSSGPWRRRLLR